MTHFLLLTLHPHNVTTLWNCTKDFLRCDTVTTVVTCVWWRSQEKVWDCRVICGGGAGKVLYGWWNFVYVHSYDGIMYQLLLTYTSKWFLLIILNWIQRTWVPPLPKKKWSVWEEKNTENRRTNPSTCLVFCFGFSWASPGLSTSLSSAENSCGRSGNHLVPCWGSGQTQDLWRGKSTPSKTRESYSWD